ncbi:MAG: flippase-like domain-containing protein [Kastovskya adunca ATA6-11-RM4]|jgi:hypothetical protein|nr:flippase-like domain-containing protein [Kastovskya adunca ATA6-11-RM4]
MKQIWSRLKPYLRWVILGGTLFFLLKTLKDHWQEAAAIRIEPTGWAILAIALSVTLTAHIWSGWVWGWILQSLSAPVKGSWSVAIYLKTNIAKYLPGNVWHFYGRVRATQAIGVSFGVATLSVLLEPLLMAAAALLIALISLERNNWKLQVLSLAVVLLAIHPRFLNFGIKLLSKFKGKATKSKSQAAAEPLQIQRYPFLPLLGELGFVGLRGTGFALTLLALGSVIPAQLPLLLSAFSLAWLLGLVVPGAPGGIGVFEVTIIALLKGNFSAGLLLSAVVLYRLISILAEAAGAGLAVLYEYRFFKLRS